MEVQFSRTPRGRPRYRPTEADSATVKLMLAAGLEHNAIRICLADGGISLNTMHQHFASELKTSELSVAAVAASQLAKAVNKGEPWAIKFWLTRRSGVKLTRLPSPCGGGGRTKYKHPHPPRAHDTRRSAGTGQEPYREKAAHRSPQAIRDQRKGHQWPPKWEAKIPTVRCRSRHSQGTCRSGRAPRTYAFMSGHKRYRAQYYVSPLPPRDRYHPK